MINFDKKPRPDGTYRAPGKDAFELSPYTDEQVAEWASDRLCIDNMLCQVELARRHRKRAESAEVVANVLDKRTYSSLSSFDARKESSFDARKEISADARYVAGRIVGTLWVIFVLIPIVLGILFEVLK